MGLNTLDTHRQDIDTALENQIKHETDDYTWLSTNYTLNLYDLDDCIIGTWIQDDDKLINYAIGEQDYLRFKIGNVPQIECKEITGLTLKLDFQISNNCGSVPVIVGVGIGKNNVLTYIHPERYLQGTETINIDCKTFNYELLEFNQLIHDKDCELEIIIYGNLSNAHTILIKPQLIYNFTSGFEKESDIIFNRIINKQLVLKHEDDTMEKITILKVL